LWFVSLKTFSKIFVKNALKTNEMTCYDCMTVWKVFSSIS